MTSRVVGAECPSRTSLSSTTSAGWNSVGSDDADAVGDVLRNVSIPLKRLYFLLVAFEGLR